MAEFSESGIRTGQILPKRDDKDAVDPTVITPDGNGVYGYQAKQYPRPELCAPRDEAAGGFLFLPNNVPESLIDDLVKIAGMASSEHKKRNQFQLQIIDAPEGMEAELGYMRKIVVADRFALRHLYGSVTDGEYDSFPEQPCDVAECIKAFIDSERSKYGTMFGSPGLAGKFGGDGYFSQEELGFGVAIENEYYHVISVWSRGWLCTK